MENYVFHYSRRLLSKSAVAPSTDVQLNKFTVDANVVMVMSVILFGLICSLFLNSIIKCAFKFSSLVLSEPSLNHRNPLYGKLANKGIKQKVLKTFPVITYTTGLEHPGLDSECVICLSDFSAEEKIKVLPKCNHCFHVQCIDKWLNSHSSCPTCRHCLIETCQKFVKGGNPVTTNYSTTNPQVATGSSSLSAPVQEIIVRIEPLQREGVVSSN